MELPPTGVFFQWDWLPVGVFPSGISFRWVLSPVGLASGGCFPSMELAVNSYLLPAGIGFRWN